MSIFVLIKIYYNSLCRRKENLAVYKYEKIIWEVIMEKKNMRRVAVLVMAGVLTMGLTACGSNGKESSGDGKLVFQIWDAGQKAGMEKLAEAYMDEHPDVKIEVQATGL